ncbi:UDP-glycosyltransferase 73C5-like [Asparagus officinalis]|uniref:UDP-glycosyltransferase 73C5-like n=1 Tax=Asparagus officinalis TaxID=4686 RepID=UPI00098E3924|nr:UDP-glycosyltransferase 73C5-like [Asparagus officinalis]
MRDQGLIIRGWAPQLMILSHPSVGGFITQLESVSASFPMVTWPNFAEQFLNEKLIVEVLRIGVSLGVKGPSKWGVENTDGRVKNDDIEKAVSSLFGEDKEAKERRKRAKELAEKAQEAYRRVFLFQSCEFHSAYECKIIASSKKIIFALVEH